jgi:hypothetical protein
MLLELETREMIEWRPWAHGVASIADGGLWTPKGWKPLEQRTQR